MHHVFQSKFTQLNIHYQNNNMSTDKPVKDIWDILHIAIPFTTFFLGYFFNYLFMPKKDRTDHKRKLTEYSANLVKDLDERFSKFQRRYMIIQMNEHLMEITFMKYELPPIVKIDFRAPLSGFSLTCLL